MIRRATSHREVIDLWPSLTAFAADVGVAYGTAKAMRRRDSIPDYLWVTVVTAASARELTDVNYELLAQLAAAKRAAAEGVAS